MMLFLYVSREEGTGSKTLKKHPKNRVFFYLSISIPLFFSRRFTALFKSSNSPLGDLPLTLSTKRSEEHTSELQSRGHLVCRLLLEKKKKDSKIHILIYK